MARGLTPSLTCTVKRYGAVVDAADIGIPLITPVCVFNAKPGGSPLAIDHVYDPVPPVAASGAEYGRPTLALGRELVVIVSGAGAGGACVIIKVRALDAAPPGFPTVTEAVPAAAMSVAGICAVSWVSLTKVVGVRSAPFQRTVTPLTKLLPFTVSVKPGPPATALLGESVVNVGVVGRR